MNEPMFIVAPPQKKRHRWLRFFAGLAVVMIILIVVVCFVATSPAFIKSVVLPRAGAAMNADITVSSMSFNPFKQIVLRDLKVQAIGQAPVFTASEVNVRYHLWDILRGNIHVDEIALNSPTVELIQNPDGSSNLDPLLKALQGKPTRAGKPKPASSNAPRIALGRLTLRNLSLVEIKNYGGGRSNVLALTNLDLALSNVKNGQSATLQVSAVLRVDETPPGGTNGFLAAAINGNFNFVLTPELKPASASGKAQLSVSSAGGAFDDFSALTAGLNCDATPTEIKQLDLHFQNGGKPLGDLAINGPLNLATMEGRLQVALQGVDRRLLNLAGAAHGVDFGSTAISSTNEITLTNSGKTIAATGRFVADKFQVTRAGQTTPALNFSADYAVTLDNAAQTALLHKLMLSGTQDGHPLLTAGLSQPMSLAWGNSAGTVGDSALNLDVTNLNLADWRPFLGNTVSAGDVNLQLKLSSRQGGKQLGYDLNSQIADLAARIVSNQTFQATVNLQAQGEATDFKQFSLSAYRLQIIRQNQPLLTASGSGAYNPADANADAQVALEVSLAGLGDAFPQPDTKISSGSLKLNGRVMQKQNTQTVTGQLTLADLTGQVGKNSFRDFGSTMNAAVSRTPERIQIQKLDGALTQNGNARGDFALTGAFEPASQTVQLSAKLSDFNQDGLRPFLEPLLAGKQLVSIAVNGNASVQYAPNSSSAVKADLQVTNLVVHDLQGQFPATPLETQLKIDTSLQKQSADIHQFQIGLTPTDRARNRIQLQGHVDFSKPKAIQGNLNLSSDGLDLTLYYDLFAGGAKASGKAVPTTSPASTASAPANQEPAPVNLPLHNFTVAANIDRLYLHELAITNFQTTVKMDGGHVLVKPFQLVLNGAPASATADLDLGVPGYKYNLNVNADQVPLGPLVNTFAPDRQGQLGGTLTTHAQIAGAGVTGMDLKQNLAGQFEVDATNLNLSVVNVRSQILKTLINVVATVPQLLSNPETAVLSLLTRATGLSKGGLMNQLQQSPIETITVQGGAGDGRINLQLAVVQSSAFEADATGTIALAPVLTNSTINIPVTILLSRAIAGQLNLTAANTSAGAYVPLPQFFTMTGTLGNPDKKINKLALVGLTVQSVGNSLIKPSNGNTSPVGNLLNQLLRR
jgi:hypothetical protein